MKPENFSKTPPQPLDEMAARQRIAKKKTAAGKASEAPKPTPPAPPKTGAN